MKISITIEEKEELKRVHRKSRDARERDKIKAIILLSEGYTIKEVAKILLFNEESIINWEIQFLNRKNLTDWLCFKYVAYDGKLMESEKEQVIAFVNNNIISDSKEVQEFIKANFNKEYTKRGIISLLQRMGFVYKKTALIPSKYDADEQKEFKDTYDTMRTTLKEDETMIFMDGVHPQHNTTCTNAWIKKGETRTVKSNTGRSRININGAYNPITQDIIIHEDQTINAKVIVESFKKIEEYYQLKRIIHVFVDNAKYYKNKVINEYLKTSRINLIFLPTYSPNLNLIERLWKLMRKSVINNKYYEKFSDFRQVLLKYFFDLPRHKELLKSFIGTELHLLTAV